MSVSDALEVQTTLVPKLQVGIPRFKSLLTRETGYIVLALAAIAAAEATFAFGNPAYAALMALSIALALVVLASLAPMEPALARVLESLALVPLYILLTASLPWFLIGNDLLLPGVYSLVLALCLWHLLRNGASLSRLFGAASSRRTTLIACGIALVIGVPLGTTEYLILRPTPPAPDFQAVYLLRDTIYMLCFVGLGEELLFRGVIQRDLSFSVGNGAALFWTSTLFMVMHLTWRSVPELGFVFVAGAVMGLFAMRTGNLLSAIVLHAVNNIMLVSVAPYWF